MFRCLSKRYTFSPMVSEMERLERDPMADFFFASPSPRAMKSTFAYMALNVSDSS